VLYSATFSVVASSSGISTIKPISNICNFITAIWPIIINTTVGVQQIQDYRNVKVLRLFNQKLFKI